MDMRVTPRQIDPFRAPKRTLGDLEADSVARLLVAASDIALVIDAKGVIRDVALGSAELVREGFHEWIGQRWVDTVQTESRVKISEMINEASSKTAPRWRQVNHKSPRGSEVPVRYSAVQVAANGRIVAVGRDLRAMAVLQQRLVDAQQSMEREYARLRHAETRYRLLFQISSEAVLIVDSAGNRVIESNPAALKLIGRSSKRLVGRPIEDLVTEESVKRLKAQIASAATSGKFDDVKARLADSKLEVFVSGSLYRQENASHLLLRIVPAQAGAAAALQSKSSLIEVVERMPDGFVLTDGACRILTANKAFTTMVQAASEEQLKDQHIDRWLGRQPVDASVLVKNLKERGEIRNFATVVRGEYGTADDVEVSAVAVATGDDQCLGFTIRNVSRRPEISGINRIAQPRSVEQLTELVGRVSLKELVRESTDMIERLCIEAALELTGDNRASAAEMLGLSRQGLYSKLRRHGLGDLEPENDA